MFYEPLFYVMCSFAGIMCSVANMMCGVADMIHCRAYIMYRAANMIVQWMVLGKPESLSDPQKDNTEVECKHSV